MKRNSFTLAIVALFAVGTLHLAGCNSSSRPATYPVTGTVTWNGKPVDGASIVFVPASEGGESAAAKSDAEGKFKLTTYAEGDGARPGQYRVKVTKYEAAKQDPNAKNLTYEEEQAAPDFDPTARPTPPPKNLLPKKYESESNSGIMHTVPEGPSTLDINIE